MFDTYHDEKRGHLWEIKLKIIQESLQITVFLIKKFHFESVTW
jgi:hypothetical protein